MQVLVREDHGKSCSNISINGGKVKCYSGYESVGIGGHNLSNVTITGGTCNIYGIWSNPAIGVKSANYNVENINILGGNIYLHIYRNEGYSNILIGAPNNPVLPVNNDKTVYGTELTLNGATADIPITNIEFLDFDGNYNIKDMYTMNNGKVYIWIPEGAKIKSITAGGKKYQAETSIEAGSTGTLY